MATVVLQVHIDSSGILQAKSTGRKITHECDIFQMACTVVAEEQVSIGNLLNGDINFLKFIIAASFRTATANASTTPPQKKTMLDKPTYKKLCQ